MFFSVDIHRAMMFFTVDIHRGAMFFDMLIHRGRMFFEIDIHRGRMFFGLNIQLSTRTQSRRDWKTALGFRLLQTLYPGRFSGSSPEKNTARAPRCEGGGFD